MSLPPLKRLFSRLLGQAAETPVDQRGGRFVAVIDCVLNQNVRDRGAASFPAMNLDVLQLCQRHDVGVLQMPCPEIAALGFPRQRPAGISLRQAMETDAARLACDDLAADVMARILALREGGATLLAVLGGNVASPGCAVHNGSECLLSASGIFMQALQHQLLAQGIDVPFHGLRDAEQALLAEDLRWLAALVGGNVA